MSKVQNYWHLYHSSCRDHYNNHMMYNSWHKIAAKLGREGNWQKNVLNCVKNFFYSSLVSIKSTHVLYCGSCLSHFLTSHLCGKHNPALELEENRHCSRQEASKIDPS